MKRKPVHKRVKAAGVGGALGVLVIALLDRYVGFHATPPEAGAITALVAYVSAWLPAAPE